MQVKRISASHCSQIIAGIPADVRRFLSALIGVIRGGFYSCCSAWVGLRRAARRAGRRRSNSVRMVLYRLEGRAIWTVFNEKVLAGLGRDLAATGQLSVDGAAQALTALKRFAAVVDGVRPAHAFVASASFGQLFALPLAEREGLFIVGIFSLLDVLLNVPMEQALAHLQLPDPVMAALGRREGIYAPFLALSVACEEADQEAIIEQAAVGQIAVREDIVAGNF